jgi:aryl-alcohol dehydrogenase-like predicted oxidoreductase
MMIIIIECRLEVPMQFTKFGQTGLTVSRMILGTGTFGKQTDEAEAHGMLKVAEAGVNFIDTADIYPPGAEVGSSEVITGRWLSNKRGRFILATKAGGAMAARARRSWKKPASSTEQATQASE